MNKSACCAQVIFWYKSQERFPFRHIAVPTPPYRVRIIVRHRLLLLARIEMKDAFCVPLQRILAPCHCLIAWCLGIFRLAHLNHRATAVPSVRRIVLLPEWVGRWQRYPIERGVFRAYLVIMLCAVLKVVAVAVLHKALPFGSHFSRGMDEVVFGMEIVGIVGLVNLLNVIQKLFECLSIAVLIEQGRESLVQFMECFS